MDPLDNECMQSMVRKMLSQELDKLPEDAKAAMGKTQVDLVRRDNRIGVVIDPRGDLDVEKAQYIILDILLAPIAQVVTHFGCRVDVEQSS